MGHNSVGLQPSTLHLWLIDGIGMGMTSTWESFSENEPPDIQTVTKRPWWRVCHS